MKYAYLIFIPWLLYSCSEQPSEIDETVSGVSNETTAEEDSIAIMGNFERQEECWNNHDLDCYVEAYHDAPDVQTVSRLGLTKGYENILNDYKTYFPEERMGKLFFDEINLKRLSDQYYYVVGRFNLVYEIPDTTIQGWFSVLMENRDGRWLMISDHSS